MKDYVSRQVVSYQSPPRRLGHPSERNLEVYRMIRRYIAEHRRSPSIREIGAACNMSSSSTVHYHLDTLERHGLIRRLPSGARSITLTDGMTKADMAEVVMRLAWGCDDEELLTLARAVVLQLGGHWERESGQ